MIGCREGPDLHDGVARLDRPLALGHGNDDQTIVPGLCAEGEHPLATCQGELEILRGKSML